MDQKLGWKGAETVVEWGADQQQLEPANDEIEGGKRSKM